MLPPGDCSRRRYRKFVQLDPTMAGNVVPSPSEKKLLINDTLAIKVARLSQSGEMAPGRWAPEVTEGKSERLARFGNF